VRDAPDNALWQAATAAVIGQPVVPWTAPPISGRWQDNQQAKRRTARRPVHGDPPAWLFAHQDEQFWRDQSEAAIWQVIEARLTARPFAFRPARDPELSLDEAPPPREATWPTGQRVRKQRNSRLTVATVLAIRRGYATGETYRHLAAQFGTCESNIKHVVRRWTWRHVAAESRSA
jgi:hypothetical protein